MVSYTKYTQEMLLLRLGSVSLILLGIEIVSFHNDLSEDVVHSLLSKDRQRSNNGNLKQS